MEDEDELPEWAKDFENKAKSELFAMMPPAALDGDELDKWRMARAQAIDALDEAAEEATQSTELPLSREERTRLLLDEMHNAELRAKLRERDAQSPLTLPEGNVAELLERQIASSAALIGHLSNYIARTDTDPSVCMSFMDRMTAMLGASAHVGKVVGRLRGVVSESRQTFAYEGGRSARGRG